MSVVAILGHETRGQEILTHKGRTIATLHEFTSSFTPTPATQTRGQIFLHTKDIMTFHRFTFVSPGCDGAVEFSHANTFVGSRSVHHSRSQHGFLLPQVIGCAALCRSISQGVYLSGIEGVEKWSLFSRSMKDVNSLVYSYDSGQNLAQ